ncbi:MAG: DNA internalization-related competence protein ComEC/Rec2 [Gammaproteobacteria bacterium]|nr:DNA internalization-related competence protein ComEC/Rec2 [Gammaproteobacteria bacterium]
MTLRPTYATTPFLINKMNLFSIAFLLGICSLFVFRQVPHLILLGSLTLISFLLFLKFKQSLKFKYIFLILFALFAGCGWVMLHAHDQINHQLPKSLEGKTIEITGQVDSLPQQTEYGTKFLFKTTLVNHEKKHDLFQLNGYQRDPMISPKPGEIWNLTVRLKRIHGFANPGSFDWEKWAFQKGIFGQGYIVNGRFIRSQWSDNLLLKFRYYLFKKIQKTLVNSNLNQKAVSSFLYALLIGDRNLITQDQWDILQKTSTNHLISIAGLHMGILAGFLFFLTSFLWRSIYPRLCLWIPSQQAAAFFSLIGVFFYAALAGFSLPTQRALVMLSVILSAVMFKRQIGLWYGICFALLIVLILHPLSILSESFWMSFGCVAILIYALSNRMHQKNVWKHWIQTPVVISIGLMPLSLWFFGEISFIGILANFLAVPYFTFVIMPLCFLIFLGLILYQPLAQLGCWLAVQGFGLLWLILKFLAGLPFGTWHYVLPNIWFLGFAVIAVLLWFAPRKFLVRCLGLVFLLPVFIWTPKTPKTGEVWFTMLDVGQGLATMVRTKNHTLIYDTGPKFNATFDAGSAVLIPFLRHENIKIIDTIVISHGDSDHIGGLDSVLKNIKVGKIVTSFPQLLKEPHTFRCYAGQNWVWDGVHFEVLWPPQNQVYQGNNSSCVLRVTTGIHDILLTGDIEKPAEGNISLGRIYATRASKSPISTILAAPHHGSRTSSSWPFIQMIHPKYVLFSTGYRNRFQFPSIVVIRRYQKVGASMYNTPNTGAITFKLGRKGTKLELYRKENEHIWNKV